MTESGAEQPRTATNPVRIGGETATSRESLDVLLPSFAVGFAVAIVVSLCDARGRERVRGAADELRQRFPNPSAMKPR